MQNKLQREKEGRIRTDYDIALLRLDYPIVDPASGMNVLNSTKFSPKTIMPICLPPHKMFRDTNRHAIAIGMGIIAEKR